MLDKATRFTPCQNCLCLGCQGGPSIGQNQGRGCAIDVEPGIHDIKIDHHVAILPWESANSIANDYYEGWRAKCLCRRRTLCVDSTSISAPNEDWQRVDIPVPCHSRRSLLSLVVLILLGKVGDKDCRLMSGRVMIQSSGVMAIWRVSARRSPELPCHPANTGDPP